MAVRLADGSEVLVAVDRGNVPEDLVLASATDPGKIAARATETLEQLLEKTTPTVAAVSNRVFEVGTEEVRAAVVARMLRPLTDAEWRRYGGRPTEL